MPYSSVAEIPESVKKRVKSSTKRRQWMHVWNSTYDKTKSESRAFAAANAVVAKKQSDALEAQKSYLYDTYEVENRRIPQEASGYTPYGATDGVGCASCHWFIAPSSCVLVSGDISPTGKSNLYASAVEMRETIMESYGMREQPKPKSTLSKVVDFIFGKKAAAALEPALSPFVLFRDNKDSLRFMAVYSNIYEDKHKQILTTESHKEYADWVSESKLYPDLHIWHCGDGSKIGKADFVDFVDGFAIASGVIDTDKEEIAYKAAESNPGVSHGFVGYLQASSGLWDKYRSFELSVLPAWAAGNETLDVLYAPGSKEFFMPFDPKKREYLESLGLEKSIIDDWEASAKSQGDNLKKLNINYRSSMESEQPAQQPAQQEPKPNPDSGVTQSNDVPKKEGEGERQQIGPTTGTTPVTEPTRELATKSELAFFAKAFADTNSALSGVVASVASLAESIKSMQSDITTLKKPADQRSAEEWHALAAATPGGHIATQQKGNQTSTEENKDAEDFFGTIVMGQVSRTLGVNVNGGS